MPSFSASPYPQLTPTSKSVHNRRPLEIVRDEFAYLDLDEEGQLKELEHGKEESSALDMLDFFSLEQKDKRVIDARHIFARKQYFDKNYCHDRPCHGR